MSTAGILQPSYPDEQTATVSCKQTLMKCFNDCTANYCTYSTGRVEEDDGIIGSWELNN